jgi:hypothetical protein
MDLVFDYASVVLLCVMLYITALKTVYDPDANKFNRYGRIVLIVSIIALVGAYLWHTVPKYL